MRKIFYGWTLFVVCIAILFITGIVNSMVHAQETKRIVTNRTEITFVGGAFSNGQLSLRVKNIPSVGDELYLGTTMGYFKVVRVVHDLTDEKKVRIYVHVLPELVRGDLPQPYESLKQSAQ